MHISGPTATVLKPGTTQTLRNKCLVLKEEALLHLM